MSFGVSRYVQAEQRPGRRVHELEISTWKTTQEQPGRAVQVMGRLVSVHVKSRLNK